MCFCTSAAGTEGRAQSVEERRAEFVSHATRFGAILTICVAVWLVTGAGYFWPVWVLLFGALSLGRRARDAYGGDETDSGSEAASPVGGRSSAEPL